MKLSFEKKAWLAFAAVQILLLIWRLIYHPAPPELRVTFLDVGQGDAAVIETPGGRTVLMDTGGRDIEGDNDEGRRTVAPFLRSRGVNRIDAMLLSHPHADHIGGAATLLNRFTVNLVMDNGQDADKPLVSEILTTAQAHHALYKTARRGQVLELGDGVVLRVLAPTETETQGPVNNASLVVRLEYGQTSLLFTGDAETDEERDLLTNGDRNALACNALKVGHHGSDTSTTPDFLAAAHPALAVVSVGKRNLYGHPRREILDRLAAGGVKTFRTDQNGAVTLISDGVRFRAETYAGN